MNNSLIFQWLFNLSGINTNLVHLDLSFNEIEGPLPIGLGDLKALSFLDLRGNNFQGKLPSVLGNLQALSILDLNSNNFQGKLPSVLGNLKALSFLDLSYNNFQGRLPSALGNLEALSLFDISHNNLQGILPNCFFNMKLLLYLSLSNNQFEGPIPQTISNINLVTHLDLSYNRFTILPKTLGNLCNLQNLYLDYNNISMELDMIIESLTGCASKSLLWLNLDGNQIWGTIPDKIGIFTSLTSLALNDNRLNGTISQNLGQLSMVQELNLSSNNLKGTLSHNHLLNLSRLNQLDLSNNPNLIVNIDADWEPPFQLIAIYLSSCILGPKFPLWLVKQKNYFNLDISNTRISDRIPKSFSSALPSELLTLDMSCNNIYEPLPKFSVAQISNNSELEIDLSFNNIGGAIPLFPHHLTSLNLSNNKFVNPIPFLCPQKNIVLCKLDLSNNFLSGALPNCWMNFDQLSILHLDNNYFSGNIPTSMVHLKELVSLHLYNNSFSGEVLKLFDSLTTLKILNLGHNTFSGHIPLTIGNNLRSLSFLSLRRNRFVGNIPSTLCQLSSLQILDLSDNHMSGPIPKCIYNITAMQNGTELLSELYFNVRYDHGHVTSYELYIDAAKIMWKRKEWSFRNSLGLVKAIDLSDNKLEGEIPIEIYNLCGLVFLNISRNNLNGSISSKIGQLTALQFLDLSSNQLYGDIPTSLGDLNFLSILDLSNNHLSGKIPDGTLLQGFDVSAYEGNEGLCGLPLPKCPWDQPPNNNPHSINHQDENRRGDIFPGLYISVILGFIIGFWGVCGSLVLNRSWRNCFFRAFENAKDKLYVMICATIARVQRKM